ncbi:hypothetical protein D3C79_896860 [compost metagenome]
MHQNIIRGNAGLARIYHLPPDNSLGRNIKIRRPVYKSRTFASKLKSNGNEVPGRGFHDNFTDRYTSGEEDIVKRSMNQCRGGLLLSFYNTNVSLIKGFCYKLLHGCAYSWSILRGLQNYTIPCCNRTYQWFN